MPEKQESEIVPGLGTDVKAFIAYGRMVVFGGREPSILSDMLALTADRRLERLYPQMKDMTPGQEAEMAIGFYEHLGPQYGWAVKFMETWQEGKKNGSGVKAVRKLIREECVFEKGRLTEIPEGVFPGIELTDINLAQLPGEARQTAEKLLTRFFAEFSYIEEHVLDIAIRIGGKRILDKPLLLMQSIEAVREEMGDKKGLVLVVGGGAGRELVETLRRGNPVVMVDQQDGRIVQDLVKETLTKHGLPNVPVEIIGSGKEPDREKIAGRGEDNTARVMILEKTDMTEPGALENLQGLLPFRTAVANYVIHELPDQLKVNLFKNMARWTDGAVRVIDGLASKRVFEVILGVFENLENRGVDLPLDMFAAVVSNMLCLNSDNWKDMAAGVVPEKNWTASIVKAPPEPLLGSLQSDIRGA